MNTITPTTVSTYQLNENESGIVATASMDLLPCGYWYVNRVRVASHKRRQGVGTQLVKFLIEERRGCQILVTPGGYGSDIEELFSFYESCGFAPINDYALVYKLASEPLHPSLNEML